MSTRGVAAVLAAGAAAYAPAVLTLTPLRRRLAPALAGLGAAPHVALTYDDGPDPASTPFFLDLLARHGRTATFFVLGRYAARHPELVVRIAREGHELAVHGWDHSCVVTKRPGRLRREVRETAELLTGLTGEPVRSVSCRRSVPPGARRRSTVATIRAGVAPASQSRPHAVHRTVRSPAARAATSASVVRTP